MWGFLREDSLILVKINDVLNGVNLTNRVWLNVHNVMNLNYRIVRA